MRNVPGRSPVKASAFVSVRSCPDVDTTTSTGGDALRSFAKRHKVSGSIPVRLRDGVGRVDERLRLPADRHRYDDPVP